MQSMTIEQLRTASDTGGVSAVTLKGKGANFFVQIATRSGVRAVLAKARSGEPRHFGTPTAALNALRDVGITTCQVDATEWNPGAKESAPGGRGRALREAHQSAAFNKYLAAEIQKSIDDPRPSIPHEEVMARMDVRIARHKAAGAKRS